MRCASCTGSRKRSVSSRVARPTSSTPRAWSAASSPRSSRSRGPAGTRSARSRTCARRRSAARGAQRIPSPPVLVAAELQPFLEPGDFVGLAVTWLAADQPTPAGDYVAIVPLLTRWVGGTELKRLPQLKVIANCAAGHDNVDLVAAELHGVVVTDTPDIVTEATADLTWALILACARRLLEGVELVRSG